MTPLYLRKMLESAVRLVPSRERWYFYCIGEGQEYLAGPLVLRAPEAVPVLIGTSPEELVRVRDALQPAQAMGFVHDVFRPGWARELPTAPALVSMAYRLSSVSDREKAPFLEGVHALLREDGLFVWSDLFLPQSLDTLSVYQEAEAEALRSRGPDPGPEEALRQVAASHAALRFPCLLDRAREMLYAAGFSNIEIPWKRFGHTVLVASK